MKVLLLYPRPSVRKECRFGYSLNLLYLASILRKAGYDPVYIDFSLDPGADNKLRSFLPHAAAAIVEIDSFPLKRSDNAFHAEALIREIRCYRPDLSIVAFGYGCMVSSRLVPGANYVYRSECETTITYVLERVMTREPIDEKVIATTPLRDLDWLPFPARDLVKGELACGGGFTRHRLAPSALIQTSRGCPGTCRFCQRKAWQKEVRVHSLEYVVAEFSSLQASGFVNIWVTDDNFGASLPRAKRIFRALAENGISRDMFIALSTWTKIDEEFLELAKQAGVRVLSFGLESASEKILEFYGKRIDLERARQLIVYADSLGLYTVGNFIIGAPMETSDTIEATFQLALSLPLDEVNLKVLTYMPGSQLFEELPEKLKLGGPLFACRENGLNAFSLTELRRAIQEFYARFRRKRAARLLRKILKHGPPYRLAGSTGCEMRRNTCSTSSRLEP